MGKINIQKTPCEDACAPRRSKRRATKSSARRCSPRTKRGVTGYNLFSKQARPMVEKAFNECDYDCLEDYNSDVMKQIGIQWRMQDEAAQAKWNAKAQAQNAQTLQTQMNTAGRYYSGMTGNFAPSANPTNMAYNAANLQQMSDFYKKKPQSAAAPAVSKTQPIQFATSANKGQSQSTYNPLYYTGDNTRQCEGSECNEFVMNKNCIGDLKTCPEQTFNGVGYRLTKGPDGKYIWLKSSVIPV